MRCGRLLAIAAPPGVLASCGGSGNSGNSPNAAPPKVPSVTQFPKVRGRTLSEVAAAAKSGPQLAPSVSLLTPGKARFGFGLFDRSNKQISDAPGAIYVARTEDSRAHGPYVARWESLAVQGHYESKTVATDPNAAKTLYVADVPFK